MKTFFIRNLKLALGLALAITLPSCLQNETTINLNKDGSGTIVEETILSAQMLQMMSQFAQPGQPDPLAEMFSEDKAKGKAGKMGEGVEYVKSEMINEGGKKGAIVHYKFADINTLKVSPGSALEDIGEGAPDGNDKKNDDVVKFKYADGKLAIIIPPTDFDEMAMPGDPNQPAEAEAMMTQMLADMRLTMKLNLPGGIEETNASYVEGNTITLYDMQVGKVIAQKDALNKISEIAKTDEKAAKEAFEKLEGVKVETKEDVTVTLK